MLSKKPNLPSSHSMLINWSNQNLFSSLRWYYLLRLNEKTISLCLLIIPLVCHRVVGRLVDMQSPNCQRVAY